MVAGINTSITRDYDSRIRSATAPAGAIDCTYDPQGRMIRKTTTAAGQATSENYILDTTGDYPVVLLALDPNGAVRHSYTHALGQTLSMTAAGNRYFYLHDRLGSIRLLLDTSGNIANSYTYDPWGNPFPSETTESTPNELRFANYRYDQTTGLYYLNARWYDPTIQRFTGRDPVRGSFSEPMTLHTYLYCRNDGVNCIDPSGKFSLAGITASLGLTTHLRTAAYVGGAALLTGGIYYGMQAGFDYIAVVNLAIYGMSYGLDTIVDIALASETAPVPIPLDPSQAPGPGFEWRGGEEGSWYNPKTGETMRPDVPHGDIGPHWDYKDPKGKWWRVWPDGTMDPK